MEPIPLRALVVLLNYERMTTDPRFADQDLLFSSLADANVINTTREQAPELFKTRPSTIERETVNEFRKSKKRDIAEPRATTFNVSPDAGPEVQNLTLAQRESIYHEAVGHDGCYKALLLFQYLFQLCPPGQQLSVQIKNEEPLLVEASSRLVMEFGISGPKFWNMNITPSRALTTITGGRDGDAHGALGFASPGSEIVDIVVDMTRRQYGDVGKGLFGESYYLGSMEDYLSSMERDVCVELENRGSAAHVNSSLDPAEEARLKACAERAWERWRKRDSEGWCAYCGKGGKLLSCGGCKKASVQYCCEEHQAFGWQQHKHTCKEVT